MLMIDGRQNVADAAPRRPSFCHLSSAVVEAALDVEGPLSAATLFSSSCSSERVSVLYSAGRGTIRMAPCWPDGDVEEVSVLHFGGAEANVCSIAAVGTQQQDFVAGGLCDGNLVLWALNREPVHSLRTPHLLANIPLMKGLAPYGALKPFASSRLLDTKLLSQNSSVLLAGVADEDGMCAVVDMGAPAPSVVDMFPTPIEGVAARSVSFSTVGNELLCGYSSGALSCFDRRSGSAVLAVQFGSAVESVAFALDGAFLAVGTADGVLHLCDRRAEKILDAITFSSAESTSSNFPLAVVPGVMDEEYLLAAYGACLGAVPLRQFLRLRCGATCWPLSRPYPRSIWNSQCSPSSAAVVLMAT